MTWSVESTSQRPTRLPASAPIRVSTATAIMTPLPKKFEVKGFSVAGMSGATL